MDRAEFDDLHWDDLRHEYASRLMEQRVPLSQGRDLLGATSGADRDPLGPEESDTGDRELLEELENLAEENGVSDGDRTRNVRSHSPVLYH